MKTWEEFLACGDTAGLIEEAEEDLIDAVRLGGRSAPAARYSASQSAEKYLRAVCEAFERPAGIMWDIRKVFDTVRDIGSLEEAAAAVEMLAAFTTPAKAGDGRTARMPEVLHAARLVKWAAMSAMGSESQRPEAPPEAPEKSCSSAEVIDSAIIPENDDNIPTVLPEDGTTRSPETTASTDADERQPRREFKRDADEPDLRPGRSVEERGASFVKVFLVCDRCGVRIPRTRQTAQGRVPCAMCGRPMKLAR